MQFDQRVEDLLTVGEEAVERGCGDAGALGDAAGGDGVDAALVDQVGRGIEDPLDGLAAAGLDGLAATTELGRVRGRCRGCWALDDSWHA